MKPNQEKIQDVTAKLEEALKEIAAGKERESVLQKEIEQLKSQKAQVPGKVSKSREQAMAALEMLKAGPVTAAQLKSLNEKYPSDPIYYVRTLLQQEVKTARIGGQTCYMLPEAYAVWQARQKAEKESKAAEAAKESLRQAPQAQEAASGAVGAAAA